MGFADLKRVLIDENEANKCRPIPLSEVSCGDIAYTGNALGVCVGFDVGHPIFAYCSPVGSVNIVNQQRGEDMGVFLGYVIQDSDELYCGCYPLPATDFYDTGYGEWSNNFFIHDFIEKYGVKEYDNEPFNKLNDMARSMNTDDEELFLATLFTKELGDSLKWEEGYPVKFFHKFLSEVGADQYKRYSFYPVGINTYEERDGTYYDYRCEIVSLDPETFCQSSGSWRFTIVMSEDGSLSIMPHSRTESFMQLQRLFGLYYYVALDDDSSEDEKLPVGKVTTDEDGNQVLAVDSTTTITLGDESNRYAVANDMDSVFSLYENSGYIVNRELGAYYEGLFRIDDDGKVTRLERGVWRSLLDGEEVGFIDERVTEYWYRDAPEYNAIFCYWGKATDEATATQSSCSTGYLLNDAFYIIEGEKADCFYDYDRNKNVFLFEQVGIRYELKEIAGELYIVSDDLERVAPGRTASFGNVTGICYKLVPEGSPKSMYYCDESYYTDYSDNGELVLHYEDFHVMDGYIYNEYAVNPQGKEVWKDYNEK